jgi:hypothetical protein
MRIVMSQYVHGGFLSMKIKLLTVLAVIVLGVSGAARGESISLDQVQGTLWNTDTMLAGNTYTFDIRFQSPNSNHLGITNGWSVYASSGSPEWDTTIIDTTGNLGGAQFDLIWTTQLFSITGSGADTVGMAGSVMFNTIGMPQGFDDIVANITIGPLVIPDNVDHEICLDSAYYPPSGVWKWAGPDVIPEWDGPHCWAVYDTASAVNTRAADGLPTEWMMSQNYPNPFNPVTQIAFDVPSRAHVTLNVFNVLGQQVATLVDQELARGSYTADWDGTSSSGGEVASGVYFYRLETDNYIDTKKMVLMK